MKDAYQPTGWYQHQNTVQGDGGRLVATLFGHAEQMNKSAALISQAPEMLALLIRSRALLDDALQAFGPCDHSVGICNCDMARAIADADVLIAKATGGES